jgi:hypothetical protein
MACPICKSNQFYVKDPHDVFETYEFQTREGKVYFDDPQAAQEAPPVTGHQEIFCQRCSWHGPLDKVEKSKEN